MIVWGTQTIRRKWGRAAEFCPLCRTVRAFRGVRVGSASHVWFISLGSGSLVGYELTCEACGTQVDVAHWRYGKERVKDKHLDLDGLIERTNPRARATYADELAAEERVLRGQATPAERRAVLEEPFLVVGDEHAEEIARPAWKPAGSAGGLFFIAVALFVLGAFIGGQVDEPGVVMVFSIAGGVLLVAAATLHATRLWRLGRRIAPRLARAVFRFEPEEAELAEILDSVEALEPVLDARDLYERAHLLYTKAQQEW